MATAEKKYDLALVQTLTEKKIKYQPWYKERLNTKYIKSLKPGNTSGQISAAHHRFAKQQVCFSRITPLQQQKREHIDEIEYGLLQHPLALYPHLEESVPTETFEDLVDILDPEMNMADEDALFDDEPQEMEDKEAGSTSPEKNENQEFEQKDDTVTVRNPYRWLPRKEENDEKKDRRIQDKKGSLSQEEHIKKVTHDFCQWIADLGGETNNIEESTITSLFASGYDTKPALSVPIHVVELTNVPPELRMSVTTPSQQQAVKPTPKPEMSPHSWRMSGNYQPSWVKFKYGAWYLPPNTWKKLDWKEELTDPLERKDKDMSEAKRKGQVLNQDLAVMHASKAFMEFTNKKGVRKPEFLEEVAEIQRKTEAEDKKRLEAELHAKQKKSLGVVKSTYNRKS
ncbi:hypothetical protein C0Q70_06471 [Pomacea canaliculata]|uniref:Protein FAM47E n=1 Tax=Pomacea canaliculata TaxID=400727 RepID=A0A2T7PP54_POMCA|nr:hypothetical protein C0Q70_06471 [Pomacea canaliculata]